MKMKPLLLAGALALSGVSLLSAKSYDITLESPVQAGPLSLAAGEYKVSLQGSTAVFKSVDNGKTFTAPVKVDQAPKKFENTALETHKVNGTERVKSIDLGGSTTELEFSGE